MKDPLYISNSELVLPKIIGTMDNGGTWVDICNTEFGLVCYSFPSKQTKDGEVLTLTNMSLRYGYVVDGVFVGSG